MPKPNSSFTVAQMKTYIREKKLNHPEVRLGMRRGEMIAGLKKAGHWDNSKSKVRPPKTKKPTRKKPRLATRDEFSAYLNRIIAES